MSNAATLVRRLFGTPGGTAPNTGALLRQAAAAHAHLLSRACARSDLALDPSLGVLLAYLRGPAPEAEKRRLLCHPLFIEGLHGLAPFSGELQRWQDSVTAPRAPPLPGQAVPAARASLGNVALAVLLRADRHWQGECILCTDVFGRLGFPFSDWSLTLSGDQHTPLARQAVTLSLEADQASWRLADTPGTPFLVLSRADCLRMIADNAAPSEPRRLRFPHPHVKPRLQCANVLARSTVRYDPFCFQDFQAHAGLTGGLVECVLTAIRRHSPAVYREFRTFMCAVRGFELPPSTYGIVGSFSDPSIPGVMGVNVPYTPQHEPRIDPFCFTWFGHELGHTKDYLIETILHSQGLALVRNPAERTEPIPRYGRALSMRTLFQVPYVHLYEWALLMDFWEGGFRGLPWRVAADVGAVGEDLAAEIEEAFALIQERVQLTPPGVAALRHFRGLFALSQARWRLVSPYVYH